MQTFFRFLLFAVAAAGVASSAAAGELTVTMADGRVTVVAQDVPLRQILAEWARVGNTRMVNAEKLAGGPLTLQLIDVPEKEALDILLRSAAGYMTAPRPADATGASLYDRVIILATSRPPAAPVNPPPPAFNRAAIPQPMPPQPPPDADDDGEPKNQDEMPAGLQNPGMPFPGPMPTMNTPGMSPNQVSPNQVSPNSPNPLAPNPLAPNQVPPNQVPNTAPRPGMLPQPPQPGPDNPYVPIGPNGRPVPGPGGRVGGPGDDDGPGADDR